MSFLGLWRKKKSYLGVDIGTASIKIVELATGPGKIPRLVTYGRAENIANFTKVDSAQDIEQIVATIKEVAQRARVTTKQAVSALPIFTVFSSVISLPAMSQKELAAAVTWEARKFVPLPIEEMILDWKLLAESKGETKTAAKDKNLRVLLTAAPQSVVKKYLDIFRRAGLELLSLETEAFALERSLMGGTAETVMIVDLGAVTTDICVVEQGIPILNRSIDVGGTTLTQAIAQSLNIDIKRAEQFKRDIGLSSSGNSGSIPKTIEATMGPIINEIKYTFNLYQSQSPQGIEKIILTGGSSFLPHLTEYLESIFQLRVYIGDPWARLSYPVEMKPILDEIGPQYAAAIGLAMRELI